jgi:hypothetical protein
MNAATGENIRLKKRRSKITMVTRQMNETKRAGRMNAIGLAHYRKLP